MPRGIWKGTLGFGLVNIGVQLYTAEAPERLDLDMLDKRDHARIRYRKVNEATGEEVAQEDIVKGYQVEKGKYVELSSEELKEANPKATQTVDIVGFVPRDSVQPIYFAKPYYVGPLKGSEKAYALLKTVLERTERVAIANVVIRTRQYVAAVFPMEDALVVQLLRYHDELRSLSSEEVEKAADAAKSLRPQELNMAEQLVESMDMEWKPEKFTDTFRKDVLALVREKAKGKVHKTPASKEAPEETSVIDLMAALKRSVEERGGRATRRTRTTAHRRPPRTRTRARKTA
jgi:DNA end-binding protein Ku